MKRRVRVCYVVKDLQEGVGQTEAIRALGRAGTGLWDSSLLCGSTSSTTSIASLESLGISVRAFDWKNPLSVNTIRFVRMADLVHMVSGVEFLPAALLSGRPLVYTFMQPDPPWLFEGKGLLRRRALSVIERRVIAHRAATMCALNPWLAAWESTRVGRAVETLPDIIDPEFCPADRLRVNGSPTILLSVGRWDGHFGRKQTHVLIQRLPEIARAVGPVELRLVGLTPEDVKQLSVLTAHISGECSVSFMGRLSRERLIEEYRNADAYVTATLVEGFYRPLVEALACGLPAVVRDGSDRVGIECQAALGHIRTSQAGAVFNDSEGTIAKAVRKVLANRKSFVEKATVYVRQFYPDQVRLHAYQLYLRALGST